MRWRSTARRSKCGIFLIHFFIQVFVFVSCLLISFVIDFLCLISLLMLPRGLIAYAFLLFIHGGRSCLSIVVIQPACFCFPVLFLFNESSISPPSLSLLGSGNPSISGPSSTNLPSPPWLSIESTFTCPYSAYERPFTHSCTCFEQPSSSSSLQSFTSRVVFCFRVSWFCGFCFGIGNQGFRRGRCFLLCFCARRFSLLYCFFFPFVSCLPLPLPFVLFCLILFVLRNYYY